METKETKFEEMREELPHEISYMMKAELKKGMHCQLDHSGDPRGPGPYKAVNTMAIKLESDYFPLHVCNVCAESLHEEGPNFEWYLFVCFQCSSTKWQHKAYVKESDRYKAQIIGMDQCPNCESVFEC